MSHWWMKSDLAPLPPPLKPPAPFTHSQLPSLSASLVLDWKWKMPHLLYTPELLYSFLLLLSLFVLSVRMRQWHLCCCVLGKPVTEQSAAPPPFRQNIDFTYCLNCLLIVMLISYSPRSALNASAHPFGCQHVLQELTNAEHVNMPICRRRWKHSFVTCSVWVIGLHTYRKGYVEMIHSPECWPNFSHD